MRRIDRHIALLTIAVVGLVACNIAHRVGKYTTTSDAIPPFTYPLQAQILMTDSDRQALFPEKRKEIFAADKPYIILDWQDSLTIVYHDSIQFSAYNFIGDDTIKLYAPQQQEADSVEKTMRSVQYTIPVKNGLERLTIVTPDSMAYPMFCKNNVTAYPAGKFKLPKHFISNIFQLSTEVLCRAPWLYFDAVYNDPNHYRNSYHADSSLLYFKLDGTWVETLKDTITDIGVYRPIQIKTLYVGYDCNMFDIYTIDRSLWTHRWQQEHNMIYKRKSGTCEGSDIFAIGKESWPYYIFNSYHNHNTIKDTLIVLMDEDILFDSRVEGWTRLNKSYYKKLRQNTNKKN
ncbi:MAG: hypothetical protein IJS13_09450 [Paludibacteraceae bacterium]|nr:hypothetical protein [Paludibacteraceae bacterium]